MSYMDVMYGNLGQVNNQFQGNLAQNAAMNQGQQAAYYQQQQQAAAQQAQLDALYGSGGFGGQTAYYAGVGADYGRQTGGFGGYGGMNDPFSPVGASGSALDMSALSGQQQSYVQQHIDRYGYAPDMSYFTGGGYDRDYGGGGSVFSTGAPAYNDYGGYANPGAFSPSPNYPGGAGGADLSSLSAQQQSYVQQHIDRYGYAPEMSYFTGGGYDRDYGGGGGGGSAFSSGAPAYSSYGGGANPGGFSPSPNYPGGTDLSSLSPAQQSYYQQHIDRYGYAPEMSFFTGSGPLSWNTMYGGGGGGTSDAPPYQGNPYYLPAPMQGGQPVQGGGGFGDPGFGGGPAGYMGFGMGIGTINGNGAPSLPPTYGIMNNGGMGYGFGGLEDNGNWGSGIQLGG